MNLNKDARGKFASRHGLSRSPEYGVWEEMIQRCTNPNNEHYARYGGRGITVCDTWFDFANFIRDMKQRPSGLSLERKNNDLGYNPDNCKWANKAEQSRNRCNNVNVTAFGRTMCIRDWSIETGIVFETLRHRIQRGVPPEKALTDKPAKTIGLVTAFGKTLSVTDWSRITGLERHFISYKIKSGLSPEEVLSMTTWKSKA